MREQRAARLSEIEARWQAATKGPWQIVLGSGEHQCTAIAHIEWDEAAQRERVTFVADCLPDYALRMGSAPADHLPNLKALAAARDDVPYLLAELRALAEEAGRLRAVIERERTAAATWIERTRAEVGRWRLMASSRGSYEWDDERYQQEFTRALDRIDGALDRAERDTNARSWDDCPTTQAEVEAARTALAPAAGTEGTTNG